MSEKPEYDPHLAGQRITALRIKKGLTGAALARASGVSAGYLREFEAGKRANARRLTLDAIAKPLGYETFEAAMDGREPPAQQEPAGHFDPVAKLIATASELLSVAEQLRAKGMHSNVNVGAPAAPQLPALAYATI